MKLILASKSPRRIELLTMLGAEIEVFPASIDEETLGAGLPPKEMVKTLAREKARAIGALLSPACPVVAADTVVDLDGTALGKPKSREEAIAMLRALSGREHQVHTGVALLEGDDCRSEVETTSVRFLSLTDEQIARYVDSGEPMDKAGAYGIQGKGSLLVEAIRGDYFNVVGLPVSLLNRMLNGRLG